MVVDLADGLRLVLTGVGEPSEGWVQISAEATNDAQREKANAITAKVEAYDFRLTLDRAELLGATNAELTTEQKG
jgi:exo-beta-1,3-glucanase (GH17 family)